jgi:hypothetical protein
VGTTEDKLLSFSQIKTWKVLLSMQWDTSKPTQAYAEASVNSRIEKSIKDELTKKLYSNRMTH